MLKTNEPYSSVSYICIFAKMWSLISLILLVAAAGHVHGVELHLSAVNLMRTDDSLPCGAVRCVDKVDPPNGYSIKSLQIRKQLNREVLVDLNQEDNSFNCKFDGITANGNWTSYKAEAGLTLYNSQDCNDAKFICEVIHVDKLGVERTGSSSGRINGRFSIATQQTRTKLTCPRAWVDDITESLSPLGNLESNVAKHITKSASKLLDKLEQIEASTTANTTCPRENIGNRTESASFLADLETKIVNYFTKSNSQMLSKLEQIQETSSSFADLQSAVENHLTKSDSQALSNQEQIEAFKTLIEISAREIATNITESLSSLADLESKVEQHVAKSDSKIQSKLEELEASVDTVAANKTTTNTAETPSSSADLEVKLESLTKSVSNILNKLDTLTDTVNQKTGAMSCTGQQTLTTCQSDESTALDDRYQVVYPRYGSPTYLCDTHGGWTIIQRRTNGNTDFFQDWFDYKRGFGSFRGNFWLGLEQIHQITSSSNHELNITMVYNGRLVYAHYDNFKVSEENRNYTLSVGAYTGTAGDSLSSHNNMQFSTKDRDNDHWGMSCAKASRGGWWYDHCHDSNLNGMWGVNNSSGPVWFTLSNKLSVTMTEMKIREMSSSSSSKYWIGF